jgi:hypothetical protein
LAHHTLILLGRTLISANQNKTAFISRNNKDIRCFASPYSLIPVESFNDIKGVSFVSNS